MSDDLISRKALLEELYRYQRQFKNGSIEKLMLSAAIGFVNIAPTAFDKEKVIEELSTLRQAEYDDSDEEPEFTDIDDILEEGKSQGRYQAYFKAIKVVEKGGIE